MRNTRRRDAQRQSGFHLSDGRSGYLRPDLSTDSSSVRARARSAKCQAFADIASDSACSRIISVKRSQGCSK